jgi:hypothetical protein
MLKTNLSQEPHSLDPGDPLARAQGCVCSPERNNDGHGVETEKGRMFYPNNDCLLHGLEAAMKILAKQGGKPATR